VDVGVVEVLVVAIFVLFVIMFVSIVIVMTLAAARSKKALEGAGLDPLAAEAQLASIFRVRADPVARHGR
jgi:hypothetical protein